LVPVVVDKIDHDEKTKPPPARVKKQAVKYNKDTNVKVNSLTHQSCQLCVPNVVCSDIIAKHVKWKQRKIFHWLLVITKTLKRSSKLNANVV
jgi:hypothetical protein